MEVEIEATAVLFDHVDGWQGRRCFRPMDVPSELEDVPVPGKEGRCVERRDRKEPP